MKDKIIFKGFYLGEDKPTIKKGEPIWLEFYKKELIQEYKYFYDNCILADRPTMSLLTYVKEKVYVIFLRGSLYK
jgi:hypothetical protein